MKTKLDAVRESVAEQGDRHDTHWEGCWRSHGHCREVYLLSLVDDLGAALKPLKLCDCVRGDYGVGILEQCSRCRALARLREPAEGGEA